jgi:hypothetical protein
LRVDDQRAPRLQTLSRDELVALQVLVHAELGRRPIAEQERPRVTPGPADFTTEWWPPD